MLKGTVEMTVLAEGPCISLSCEGMKNKYVIHRNRESVAHVKMAKIMDSLVNGRTLDLRLSSSFLPSVACG